MDVAQATSAVQEGEELELIYIYIYGSFPSAESSSCFCISSGPESNLSPPLSGTPSSSSSSKENGFYFAPSFLPLFLPSLSLLF